MDFSKAFTPGRIVLLAVVTAALLGGCGLYGYANTVRTQGVQQEQALTGQYKVNQNELSTYVTKIYEMTDVANLKSAKLDTILTHAVQGRYGTEGFKPNGAFFSAIQEAYPTIDLTVYDRLLTAVEAGREAFKNKQDKLTDMKRAYDTWRYDGIVRSHFAQKYFPSRMLQVTVNGKLYTDSSALRMIDQMVLAEQASTAFETGKMPTLDIKGR